MTFRSCYTILFFYTIRYLYTRRQP